MVVRDDSGEGSPEERAYDEYLEALLRGESEDVESFLARRGASGDAVRKRLEGAAAILRGLPPAKGDRAHHREAGLPFEHLGEFRLLRRIGEGGMGVVYLAEQESLGRLVALKVVRPERSGSEEVASRFRREAQAIAKLRHPNVVSVYATGEEGGVGWIAMELIPGESLEDVLREARSTGDGPPVSAFVRWIAGIARGLQAAHEASIVHRDVKPANILITPDGRALLVDFGLARGAESEGLTRSGEFRGTACYASPEQVRGTRGVDARTDVFSLGATLYECVTGKTPFAGETTEQVFHQILTRDPTAPRASNPRVPRDLETVLLAALEKEPARRYPSARALADDLEAILELRPIAARRPGIGARARRWARRHPAASTAVAILLLAGIGGPAVLAAQRAFAFRSHLRVAREALGASDRALARDALAKARAIDPGDEGLRDAESLLGKAEAHAAAEEALGEAERELEECRERTRRIDALRARVELLEGRMRGGEVSAEDGEELARRRREVEDQARNRDALYESVVEHLLPRASSLEPTNPTAEGLHAEVQVARYREAIREEDEARADAFRRRAEEHLERWGEKVEAWRRLASDGDPVALRSLRDKEEAFLRAGRLREEIDAGATVALEGTPQGAEVYLFRYVSHAQLRPDGEERLVPVPFHPERGSPPAPERGAFAPGDVVLAVESVEEGSLAAEAGLRAGDLLLAVAGHPVPGTVFLAAIEPGGRAGAAGARALDRVATFASREVSERYDVEAAHAALAAWTPYDVEILSDGRGTRISALRGDRPEGDLGAEILEPEEAIERPPLEEGLDLLVLASGEAREVRLRGAGPTGLRAVRTAFPLAFSPFNLVGRLPIPRLDLGRGSYLFVLRQAGFEDLRLPVHVPVGARLQLEVDLHARGSGPPGFVWVPEGPVWVGGDLEAVTSFEGRRVFVAGFWIARAEVTVGEYLHFLNDPATQARISDAERRGALSLVPREALASPAPRILWSRGPDGRFDPPWDRRWPIHGVSYEDIKAYCRWRSERDPRMSYDMPTASEWEKAARGADGRKYPWGDHFIPGFCKWGGARPGPAREQRPEPVLRFVRDESPYGVRDMSGGVLEWVTAVYDDSSRTPYWRGGTYRSRDVRMFRAASLSGGHTDRPGLNDGIRLVARPK